MNSYRIGHGYDAHRLVKGRKLVLGGVEIPHTMGLLGHSDADVLIHAVIDAILGAMGLGDIGIHFPDTDQKYKNISSLSLLVKVRDMLSSNGYEISNIDTTLIVQKPKIAPYIPKMLVEMATALNIDVERINIKATTEEGLGFTGREEGICAHAVVLIVK